MNVAQRHYGLDWLRIAAFALLVPYHAALVFAPAHWLVNAREGVDALVVPMALMTPWRLALLFAVSGFASRKLLGKSDDIRAFLASRSARLLVPLGFAMVALLPLEVWIRAVQGGYQQGLAAFWLRDYWRWGTYWGVEMPSWEHLWFVAYLWFYTMVLGALLALGLLPRLQRWFDDLTAGIGLLWLPIAGLVLAKLAVTFVLPEHGGVLTDWNAHATNFPLFVLGFLIAGGRHAWGDIARLWRQAALAACVCAAIVVHTDLTWSASEMPSHFWTALDRAARMAMAWSMIVLLFHAANTRFNRDHPWRATLAEAVFPAYIVHQVAIVAIAWWMRPAGGTAWLGEYALILGGTLATCAAFYLVGSRIAPLRPLIGLAARKATAKPVASPAVSA
ncbi:acyltransferase family protein [Sphingomonas gilva]|uniref:acyltransferase family protein n=1 Tax=Sphingomonas gilva TaxID=2305907 RepID=UPI0015F93C4D|nr:acyltransferase [Sphingomonas gilva]